MAAGIETSSYEQLNHAAKRAKQKNRAIFERIFEAIVFLGRCGLPLRGDKDSGSPLTSTLDQSVGFNEGNFRHLMATYGDEVMNKHLQTCNRTQHTYHGAHKTSSFNQLVPFLLRKLFLKLVKPSFSRSWQMKK